MLCGSVRQSTRRVNERERERSSHGFLLLNHHFVVDSTVLLALHTQTHTHARYMVLQTSIIRESDVSSRHETLALDVCFEFRSHSQQSFSGMATRQHIIINTITALLFVCVCVQLMLCDQSSHPSSQLKEVVNPTLFLNPLTLPSISAHFLEIRSDIILFFSVCILCLFLYNECACVSS